MIYLTWIDSKDWARRYGFPEDYTMECPVCNKEIPMNRPIAIKGYRGLAMELHGCPEDHAPRTFRPVEPELKKKWDKAIFG